MSEIRTYYGLLRRAHAFRRRAGKLARLDLDEAGRAEGRRRHQVDLAGACFQSPRQNAIAFQPQPQSGAAFACVTPALGSDAIPFHRLSSFSASALS